MNRSILQYDSYIFDFDGVLFKTNQLKTEAFREVGRRFGGNAAARQLVNYHMENGGISRDRKFSWFFRQVLAVESPEVHEVKALCDFAMLVGEGLASVEPVEGAKDFLQQIPASATIGVLSGGREDEIRKLLVREDVLGYFDWIVDGRTPKETALRLLLDQRMIEGACVVFGDSQVDYEAAEGVGFDFVFVNKYAEAADWVSSVPALHEIGTFLDLND